MTGALRRCSAGAIGAFLRALSTLRVPVPAERVDEALSVLWRLAPNDNYDNDSFCKDNSMN